MDLNPLDPKTAQAPTVGGRRRDGGEAGFRGVMDLMAHLAARPPSPTETTNRPKPANEIGADRSRRDESRPERAERRETAETDTAQRSDRPRRERHAAETDGAAAHPLSNPDPARNGQAAAMARTGTEAGDSTAPLSEAPGSEDHPHAPATTPAPTSFGVPADAEADGPATPTAATPGAGTDQAAAAVASAAQAAASAPQGQATQSQLAQSMVTEAPVSKAQTPAAQTPTAQTPAAQTPAAQTPAAPTLVTQTPATQTPATQTPAAQPAAAQAPADSVPPVAPTSDIAVAQDAAPKKKGLPHDAKVSVEPAPTVARAQGVSSAVLVQAHMAGGDAGKAAAGQPALAQAASQQQATLHVGGGQALFVGADSGNAQAGAGPNGDGGQTGGQAGGQTGGQAGGQNTGGQNTGGQAQAGFAFGAATIGQRGFGGDSARAQFQEILSTRTARAPLQGPGGTMAGNPSSLSFTAGPGGPQSTLNTAMASGAEATARGRPGALPSTAAGQVALKLAGSAADGGGRITIRLNPEELGKVDVKLEIGRDGQVRALISADRPETLDMLQRDARMLEKALQDAGLKTGQNSLEFDLRGGDGQPADRGDRQMAAERGPDTTEDDVVGERAEAAPENDPGGVRSDGSYDLVA